MNANQPLDNQEIKKSFSPKRYYQDALLEDYTPYDYSEVEDIAGVDYKKAMILTGIYIALHLFAKSTFGSFSPIWILLTTGLSVAIWIYFKKYFDAMNDQATGKWLQAVIGGIVLYGLINLFASFAFSFENLRDLSKVDIKLIEGLANTTFQLSLIPILIIFAAGIKIISVNFKHPFPLKRIAVSAMLMIPIYMLLSIVENLPILEELFLFVNFLIAVFDYAFGDGNPELMQSFKIGFMGNLFLMLPYYFLLHHFYRAEIDDATP